MADTRRKKAASEIRSRKAMEIHCLILRVSSEEGNFTKAKGKNVPCKRWGCSSAGRAPALQAGGQEFDSPHLHQITLKDFKCLRVRDVL